MTLKGFRGFAWITTVVVVCGVLGLYRADRAVSQPPQLPFSNSVEQRAEMIKELREIRKLLEEQNRILRQQVPHSSDRPTPSTRNQPRRSRR